MNRRFTGLLLLVGGIVFGQAVLYGPSLVGKKILLPLDILASPGFYLPRTAEVEQVEIQNRYLQDLVCVFEPARRFAAGEVRAGRLPMWLPYQFGGAPFIEPKLSPFLAPQFCIESPLIIPWTQMLAALVAGCGAYLFFRAALGVRFWPAVVCAWCYPLTAFFIFWQGFPTADSVYWLPWLLLAVEKTGGGGCRYAAPGLAVVTALVLISGHLDVAAQVLLASGLFALWILFGRFQKNRSGVRLFHAVASLSAAWVLGILVATPQLLPLLEYIHTGARLERRSGGEEERPPVGISALPQAVLPDMYGAYGPDKAGSYRFVPDTQSESTAAAYAGVIAALFLAPLALGSRRHRRFNIFAVAMIGLGLAWLLNVPGVVTLLRLPGVNLMSHNRLVFLVCFAVLALGAIGLEHLLEGPPQWRGWMWCPAVLLGVLCAWCLYRAASPPEPIATQLEQGVLQGKPLGWVHELSAVHRVQHWFTTHYLVAGGFCALGLAAWLAVRLRPGWHYRLLPVLASLMLGELLWFGYGQNVQCDPWLYYPTVKVLDEVAHSAPGRIAGYFCLPATLAGACGLKDLRGYDGIDPLRIVELLELAAGPPTSRPKYAQTQYLVPRAIPTPEGGVRLPPVLDMLGVRYVVFRGSPMAGSRPIFQGPDYWVLLNSNALERVFVPRAVEFVPDKSDRLRKLGSDRFNPREVAYTEVPVELPPVCQGTATIEEEVPLSVRISARMTTAGLLVLSDRWDAGWHAYAEGRQVPILQVNHAVRGVVLPAGTSTVVFRYESGSLALGLKLAGGAALLLVVWTALLWRGRNRDLEATASEPQENLPSIKKMDEPKGQDQPGD